MSPHELRVHMQVVNSPNSEFAAREAGFMLVEVRVETMEVSFINAHGDTVFTRRQTRAKTKKNAAPGTVG